ncbi:MAG: cytochrome c biogenesis protein [Anaerolineae bacterium]
MERWGTHKLAMALHGLAGAAILFALYMALGFAPTEASMGDVQRIFYWHVATAWVGFFAFFITLVASIAYLRTGRRRWDIVALSSVEIGLAFAVIMTVTGSLWAKPVWNTWWTWEPRLTTVAIMLLIYATYLLLRRVIEDPGRRARFAAVYGIAGFVSVPITFMAIRWWRTIHPVIFESEGFHLTSTMLAALIVSVLAYSLLYFSLLLLRTQLEFLSDEVAELRESLEE